MEITYKIAIANAAFEKGRVLFQEYADVLNLDLSFQDFAHELKTIHRQ